MTIEHDESQIWNPLQFSYVICSDDKAFCAIPPERSGCKPALSDYSHIPPLFTPTKCRKIYDGSPCGNAEEAPGGTCCVLKPY